MAVALCWGQDAGTFRRQAEAAWRAGQYAQARAAYLEAIRREPNDAESFEGLGKVYSKLGQLQEAANASKKAAELYEKQADQLLKRATPIARPTPPPVQQTAAAPPSAAATPVVKPADSGTGQAPPAGVYACYSVRSVPNAPGCVRTAMGCFGMKIEVAPTVMFGLIDGTTYSDYDGKRGHYKYDAQSGRLTMIDGSRQGWSYKRVASWSFRMLDPQGKETAYTCPLDPKKDVSKRPW